MNKFSLGMISLVSLIAVALPAFAHCPLCSAATGAMVATARVVGIDDAIVGTFIGAFTISTAFWMNKVLVKRIKRQLPLQPYILSVVFLILTIVGFYSTGLLGTMPDFLQIFGMERLVFGLVFGSVVSVAGFEIHKIFRKFNGNKNHIPLQGIILPIILLLVADAGMYLLGVV